MISAECNAAFADLVVDEGARYLEEGRRFWFFLFLLFEKWLLNLQKNVPLWYGLSVRA